MSAWCHYYYPHKDINRSKVDDRWWIQNDTIKNNKQIKIQVDRNRLQTMLQWTIRCHQRNILNKAHLPSIKNNNSRDLISVFFFCLFYPFAVSSAAVDSEAIVVMWKKRWTVCVASGPCELLWSMRVKWSLWSRYPSDSYATDMKRNEFWIRYKKAN